MNRLFFPSLLIALIVIASVASPGEARFIVSPMELHLEIAGGGRGGMPISITNTGDEPISLKLYLGDSRFIPDGSEVNMPVGGHPRSCATWVQLGEQVLELAPGKSKEVPVILEVPTGMRGSFWSKLYVEEITGPAPATGTHNDRTYRIYTKQRMGIRIFQNVPGTMNRLARIDDVSVEMASAQTVPIVNFRVSNTGNTLLRCVGSVELRDSEGTTVDTLPVGEDGRFTLFPDSYRDLTLEGEAPIAPGSYTALAIVDFGGPYLVAGDAVFSVDDETAPVVAAVTTAGKVYTVQIKAASSEREANAFIEKNRTALDEELYIVRADPYFKVRGGSFASSSDADMFLRKVKEQGFHSAWITTKPPESDDVQSPPVAALEAEEILPEPPPEPEAAAAPPVSSQPEWRVQVFATADSVRAETFAQEIRLKTGTLVRVDREAAQFKVRVGGSPDREGAVLLKHKLMTSGYDKSWIIRAAAKGDE